MNIHGLKKKKKKIKEHLKRLEGRQVSRNHMDEQKSARATINRKINTIKKEKEKKHAHR